MLRFPPVVSRALIEKSGYLKSFPHLLGCVCALERERRRDRRGGRPIRRGRGLDRRLESERPRARAGRLLSDLSPRRRARTDPGRGLDLRRRLRLLPPRAFARHRSPAVVPHARICLHRPRPNRCSDFRERWMTRATGIADALGLSYRVEAASDPFFGRGGRAGRQDAGRPGAEIRAARPGALGRGADGLHELQLPPRSFRPDLGHARRRRGERAHTGCVAFGMDRLAVALFAAHGAEVAQWPQSVRATLGI